MKRTLILIAIMSHIMSYAQAQSYKINKHNYNINDYYKHQNDPNNPLLCGLASYFVPGLGQIIAGETGRGLAFFGGTVVAGLFTGGSFLAFVVTGSQQYVAPMLIGMGSIVIVQLWSVADAIKVAKINNLYARDKFNTSSYHLELSPYVSPVSSINPAQSSVGMSLRLCF
jgi:hypothetical protein